MSAKKSKNPDYVQICGYIHKELGNKFRGYCKMQNIEISTLLESFIQQWVEVIESNDNTPPKSGSSDKNDETSPQ